MIRWWLALSNAYMPPSQTDDWATPIELWNKLDQMHDFDVDAAASQANLNPIETLVRSEYATAAI